MDKNKEEIILGLDIGDANIGVALGSHGLTMPLKVVNAANTDVAISDIARHVFDNKVNKIIVGYPVMPDGSITDQTLKVKAFMRKFSLRIKKPVVLINEYLSSKEALDNAISLGISKKSRRVIDSLAAEVLIRRYYQENQAN